MIDLAETPQATWKIVGLITARVVSTFYGARPRLTHRVIV